MKRYFVLFALIVAALTCGAGNQTEAKAGTLSTRGVWVSCFEYEDLGLQDKSVEVFQTNVNKLFAKIKASGCNTVYFHVRAYDDAIYPSSVTGWSKKLTTSGEAPDYDPLKILVSSAHIHGLKFHAWLNPYRVTKKKVLDPGKTSTTTRIVKQVREIVENYDVDGIHFDDYFYPTNEKKYNSVSKATRMANVNAMVRKVYKTIKEIDSSVKFGISPAGDISYCEKIGADVKTWMSNSGYVDYIVPQIYWSNKYRMSGKIKKLYSQRLAKWRKLNKKDVPMYVGLALYKAGYSVSGDLGWSRTNTNLANQVRKIKSGNTEGYVLFSATDLYRDTAKKEINNLLQVIGKMKMKTKRKTLKVGKRSKLYVSATPYRMKRQIRWRSANKKIATVTKKGVVKAKKKGKVRIYAYFGKKKTYCTVTVR